MIVECPSCQTRYGIEAAKLHDLPSPRFHCSSCGFYFSLNSKPTDQSLNQSIKVEWPKKPEEIEKIKKELEITSSKYRIVGEVKSGTSVFHSRDEEIEKISPKVETPKAKLVKPIKKKHFLPKKVTQKVSIARPALIFASVPIFACVLISSYAFETTKLPNSVRHSLNLNTEHLAHIPPKGLELSDIDSKITVLDSGEKVLELNGTINNNTLAYFEDLQLEATLFNANNNKVSSVRIPGNSVITNAKIKSFSRKELNTLQKKKLIELEQIKANSSRNFKLIIPELPKEAKWFSTKIYSVKNA